MIDKSLFQRLEDSKIIAVVRGNLEQEQIIPLADALVGGGINAIEVTCNTDGVESMIAALSAHFEDSVLIGAGTVVSVDLCKTVIESGAEFIVAPDLNIDVVNYCQKNDIVVIPGVLTPTEVLQARRSGLNLVKLFPAGVMGAKYIKSLMGPIDDMEFMPTGGVNLQNIPEFREIGCKLFGVGGSLIKKELIGKSDWQALTELTKEYMKVAS